jgi:hypothetical protein
MKEDYNKEKREGVLANQSMDGCRLIWIMTQPM